MKVKELMNILKHTNPELDVVMFAKGDWFPVLGTQEWTENDNTVLELGGGWDSMEGSIEDIINN
jgi:hypothetical protein